MEGVPHVYSLTAQPFAELISGLFTPTPVGDFQLIDVTDHVRAVVSEADVAEGIALVSTPHTTCAVIVNESEPGFEQDLRDALERLAPAGAPYEHNDAPHAEEFEARFGHTTIPPFTESAYDAAMLIGLAAVKAFVDGHTDAGEITGVVLRDRLREVANAPGESIVAGKV